MLFIQFVDVADTRLDVLVLLMFIPDHDLVQNLTALFGVNVHAGFCKAPAASSLIDAHDAFWLTVHETILDLHRFTSGLQGSDVSV